MILYRWIALLLIAVLTLGVMGCSKSVESQQAASNSANNEKAVESSQKVTIKVADSIPTSHLNNKVVTKWIERMEELGKGKIEVEYYPAEQMGKASSLLSTVKNKVADITYLGAAYFGDVMPLSAIAGNPGLIQDAVSGSKAYHKLVQEDLYELEFKPNGVKPLWSATSNPNQIVTSKQPVKSIEDFNSLKIRTSGGIQEQMVQAWGATSVVVSGPEIFTSWERGAIDGTLMALFSWPGYQIEKIAKYATVNASLSAFGYTYAVNEEVWNSWPKDVQDAVKQASEEIVEFAGQITVDKEVELLDGFKKLNIEFYTLPDAEIEKWTAAIEPFNKKWAADLDAKNLPASKILEKFTQYINEFNP